MISSAVYRWYLYWIAVIQQVWDRYWFYGLRIDYYDYLAALLSGLGGRRTLKDVFLNDAIRYKTGSLRGRLSRKWLSTYQRSGGDLYATWEDHLPRTEVVMIRAAQSAGNDALVKALEELSRVLRLLQDAWRILHGTLWPAALAVCVVTLVSIALPWFTLPRLMDAFVMVPAEYYGRLTRRLLMFADFLDAYYLIVLGAVTVTVWVMFRSLATASGPVRRRFDDFLWWKVYRHLQALQFLAFLKISLGDDLRHSVQLRSALIRLRAGSSDWLSSHIDMMLARLDQGLAGPETFDTGLFTREQFWFLSDVMTARGLAVGLVLTRNRIQHQILTSVARQAAVMRWVILLGCVAYVMGLALWHYAVIDELRRALTFYFSS